MKELKELTAVEKAISNLDDITSLIRSGDAPALLPYITSKKFSKRIEKFDSDIRELALEEAKMYESKFSVNGINVEYRNGAGRYTYKHDDEWNSFQEQIDKLRELQKQREELMKTAMRHEGEFIVDGEIVPPATVKYNSDSLIVK
jgi:hypothetical protein